jgi:ABC-type multidrug transport system permease subunit
MIIGASTTINRLATDLRKYLDPPLIELEVAVSDGKKPTFNFAALFFPAMIFMSLLFVANGLADEIWRERSFGTLRRTAMMPVSLAAFLAGRLVFVALVLCAVALVGLTAMRALTDVAAADLPMAMLWIVFSGTVFYLLLLLMAVYASSERAANVLGNLLIFPLMLVGGSMFPFELMPRWMADIGRWTPNGWALTQFRAILSGSASPSALAIALGGLGAISGLLFWLVLRRLRSGFLM